MSGEDEGQRAGSDVDMVSRAYAYPTGGGTLINACHCLGVDRGSDIKQHGGYGHSLDASAAMWTRSITFLSRGHERGVVEEANSQHAPACAFCTTNKPVEGDW